MANEGGRIVNRKLGLLMAVGLTASLLLPWAAVASDGQIYFSADKNGQNRVTNIQEGDEIFIVVIDNDQNIDCDIRDKIWADIKLMDPKTGATIIWESYEDDTGSPPGNLVGTAGYVPYKGHAPGTPGWLGGDYLEETGADTGVFVSSRAFQVGRRESYSAAHPEWHTHVVDVLSGGALHDFMWGHYMYSDELPGGASNEIPDNPYEDNRGWFGGSAWLQFHIGWDLFNPRVTASPRMPSELTDIGGDDWLVGRFENMDTLIGMYQDQNDDTDVAVAMMKLIDTEATVLWDAEIYKDANGAATITVVDPDENLNCNEVEAVPVFILVNPGSWNPVQTDSPTTFCALKRTGGIDGTDGDVGCLPDPCPIRWYNIYSAQPNFPAVGIQPARGAGDGRYYIQYDVAAFDTADDVNGYTPVSFYAWETGVNTGVFQLNLNSILTDLEFNSLDVRDVLVAYYLDPNDFDDFKLATAYIEAKQHSNTAFTDESRAEKDLYWIGRDPVYVQVIDANANVDPCCPEQVVVHVCDPHGEDDVEWLILDEISSNSSVFFTFAGTQLWPVWDALGVGLADSTGGFQLQPDNWKLEVFNEDDVYARYNDVYYETDNTGMAGLGDIDTGTAFPPTIDRVRVANDVSFDLMSIGDTQVYDGQETTMWFLDRQGNRISGYVNSDCVFVEVVDPDQDEDQYRRERIDGYWDGGQNFPFGPQPLNDFVCPFVRVNEHPLNVLLGDTNIFNDSPDPYDPAEFDGTDGQAKLYVLNPRSGHWAAVDLLETGAATGDFISVTCIDLTSVYSECVPTLGVLPGDTIVAFYQDPSNHSDNAMISIKVGIGGGGTSPSQQSTTMFVDADGNQVANYTDADMVYVKVIDPSHAGATLLANAVEIDGVEYDVTPFGAADAFITEGLDLGLAAGDEITATYTDPTDLTDTSSDTITVIASVLVVEDFYAGPNPFDTEVTFGFNGTGIATTMTVTVYDLAGGIVWETTQTDVSEITWDGAGCANGAYIYVITATDGTNTYPGTGKVFINR